MAMAMQHGMSLGILTFSAYFSFTNSNISHASDATWAGLPDEQW